ncbi:unnamed protein product [Fraxinus pennsylvanica]|uniref:Wall-associated receptor kinase C-terminal domain-containing protein n=1 Tax=Fraxinus pennsylvanica TaxID=56036 RepID=A0AAD2A149_9LAMI|nr:unnamed protein product [Fraxinus pennsylvanica]
MGEYEEILRRGFALNWSIIDDCGRCERSGGRCGFNTTTFRFRCFCLDGPSSSCRPRRIVPGRSKLKLVVAAGASASAEINLGFLVLKVYFFYIDLDYGQHSNSQATMTSSLRVAPLVFCEPSNQ